MSGDPPEEFQGLHWHDRETCPFSREEGEAFFTYTESDMSRRAGDNMLQWACNVAYKPGRLRYRNVRSLSLAVRRHYVPEGVKGINFHEPLDGHQNLMFYHRDLLPLIKRLLSRPTFANNTYTRFRLVRDREGIRIIGAFNTGDWYEFAHVVAQKKGGGGPSPVTVVPLLCSTDATVARKNMPVYVFLVSIGCLGDRHRSEPGNWLMVACLPHYNDQAAKNAHRPDRGPLSIPRRKVRLARAFELMRSSVTLMHVYKGFAQSTHQVCSRFDHGSPGDARWS